MSSKRQLIVTSALPYANGPLHLGHMVEHIQTDIWVRAHRMLGISCLSLCGDDAHGTPIMLKAEQLGITPEELTAEVKASHECAQDGTSSGYRINGADYATGLPEVLQRQLYDQW